MSKEASKVAGIIADSVFIRGVELEYYTSRLEDAYEPLKRFFAESIDDQTRREIEAAVLRRVADKWEKHAYVELLRIEADRIDRGE